MFYMDKLLYPYRHLIDEVCWKGGRIVAICFSARAWGSELLSNACIHLGEMLWDKHGIHYAFNVEVG